MGKGKGGGVERKGGGGGEGGVGHKNKRTLGFPAFCLF